ncbi:pyridoxamine kinase [Vibrio mimicus]|uniref:pyridoxal kinase n=1 Tax=Vibrio mimicus TaxID=674 RepID=A0A2J9UYN0_VIBMI|nr:pyridoxamine kinase [Vibrio mimicus]EEW10071.1 Pyridoxamine kinase [Vibrio mimicus VM573]KFE31675.1 pfkB carbohydrate kinase family protein [Vibrio mimicus]PNM56618.1 pyridoxamine kinase [Vibrio mimicus]
MKSVVSIHRHELYGKLGNDLLVFLLDKMGLKTFPIHTVQISNHTLTFDYIEIKSKNRNILNYSINETETNEDFSNFYVRLTMSQSNVELSNYIDIIIKNIPFDTIHVLSSIFDNINKKHNIRYNLHGIIINLIPMADIVILTQSELEKLTNIVIESFDDIILACKALMNLGAKIILINDLLVKLDKQQTIMLGYNGQCYITSHPELLFHLIDNRYLTSILFIAALLESMSPLDALSYSNTVSYTAIKEAHDLEKNEINILTTDGYMSNPITHFPIGKCIEDASITYYSF